MRDTPADTTPPRFDDYWLTELLRLREAELGPLSDAAEVRRITARPGTFAQRLLARARLLAQRERLLPLLARWRQAARLSLLGLALLAILTGALTASAVLGDGSRPVNLALALMASLGLHLLTLLFWLLSLALPGGQAPTRLGSLWLWLTQRWSRGPDAALVPRAWIEVLARAGALRWLLAAVTHAVWSLALLSLTAALLVLLAARRYQFQWETTLLSPEAFVDFAGILGWLPARLGFAVPHDAVVRASDGLQVLPADAHALWSGWLIGSVVVYGVLPRLALLAASLFALRARLAGLSVPEQLPGHAELRPRLMPASAAADDDGPAPGRQSAHLRAAPLPAPASGNAAVAGIELPPELGWPPPFLPAGAHDFGIVDDRGQRQRLATQLLAAPPARLLLVCDAAQTPDRGTIALLVELAGLADQARVLLVAAPQAGGAPAAGRSEQWQERLRAADFAPEHLLFDTAAARLWLTGDPAAEPAPRERGAHDAA